MISFAIALASTGMLMVQYDGYPPPPPPPSFLGNTSRAHSIDFVADDVIRLQAAIGFQVTIELAQDEQVENVAVGDSSAWQVTANHKGNRLFVKPLSGDAVTNMVVITDARLYSFELSSVEVDSPDLPYIVRFRYPSSAEGVPIMIPSSVSPGQGARYKLRGDKGLRPEMMRDDGVRTYIQWPRDRPLAAIYAVNDDGEEMLVDSNVRGDSIVIDSIHNRIVFRRDRQRATGIRMPGDGK